VRSAGTAIGAAIAALVVSAGITAPLQAAEERPVEEMVVTGSFIRGTPEDAPSPVLVMSREELVGSGVSDIGEAVRNLSITSGSDTAPTDGTRFNGATGGGLANVNLRGLGPTSTLVLLDGKRLPYAGQKLADGDRFVDINSIPITMVERVEVLKDGGSALYGSDAIAGVVNFITRSEFEGFELRYNYQQTTSGSQDDQTLGAIWGISTEDGRGHFVIGGEYFDRGQLESSERKQLLRDQFAKQDA
jgi:outer membrane receptor for ferrienterochelin and colicin